jgi:branched-chain amino acid transport system substrate-binding protein
MPESNEFDSIDHELPALSGSKAVSRRDFLKVAGVAGVAVGAVGGLGGVLAACGGTATTTTAASSSTTVASSGTTVAASSTTASAPGTTVSTSAEMGREIKFGFMTPKTGGLAGFGTADGWCAERWGEYAKAGSLMTADGKAHPMSVVVKDTQSDINYGGTVAADLITNDKVDVLMAASTTSTTVPAALQAEALGCPAVLTDAPADSLINALGGKSDTVYKWWNMAFWNNQALLNASIALYGDAGVPSNKVMGCLWPNNVEGNDRRRFYPPAMQKLGYTIVDGGAFEVGMENWGTIINQFKKAGAEILQGLMIPPDMATFWKQCYQSSYIPKIVDIGITTLFPTTQEALGKTEAIGFCGQNWWHPLYPWKSSLTGETCAELALDHEKRTGQQWTQPQEHYMLFEWAVDALKRTKNVDDKEEILKNLASAKMETIVGPIDFTSAVETGSTKIGTRAFPNVVSVPMHMDQWVKGEVQRPWSTKIWTYDLVIVEESDTGGFFKRQQAPVPLPATTFK